MEYIFPSYLSYFVNDFLFSGISWSFTHDWMNSPSSILFIIFVNLIIWTSLPLVYFDRPSIVFVIYASCYSIMEVSITIACTIIIKDEKYCWNITWIVMGLRSDTRVYQRKFSAQDIIIFHHKMIIWLNRTFFWQP